MIWSALFLLVVAAILLVAGIVRSSFGLLLLSFGSTLVAIGLLYAAFRYYRRKAVLGSPAGEDLLVVAPGYPGSYATPVASAQEVAPGTGASADPLAPATLVQPVAAVAVAPPTAPAPMTEVTPVTPLATTNGSYGNGSGTGSVSARASGTGLPIADWDHLDAPGATAMVEALNLDELFEVRRHEIEHAGRASVVTAIDARVEHLIALRRSVQGR